MECAFDPDLEELWNLVYSDVPTLCLQIGIEPHFERPLAEAHHVVVIEDLAAFITGLADEHAGWEGTRRWHSGLRDLDVAAAFRSRGHVDLTWTIGNDRKAERYWQASVTVTLEAGEQLLRLEGDLRRFLCP